MHFVKKLEPFVKSIKAYKSFNGLVFCPFAYRINANIIVNRFNVETFIMYKYVDIVFDSICWLNFFKLNLIYLEMQVMQINNIFYVILKLSNGIFLKK